MAETRILMVVKEAGARAAYEEALRRTGVCYDVADSFTDLQRLSTDNAYSGLLVDILTLIRSSKEEKGIAYDCLNYYPSLRVKWDARNRGINLSPLEQQFAADAESTLSQFIEKRCRPFTARTLRRFERKEIFLSLLLAQESELAGQPSQKSFTANISRGGAFVHTTRETARGETVWLRFPDLPDLEPLTATVCWSIAWGSCRSIPGIGVRFEYSCEEQRERLSKMANL